MSKPVNVLKRMFVMFIAAFMLLGGINIPKAYAVSASLLSRDFNEFETGKKPSDIINRNLSASANATITVESRNGDDKYLKVTNALGGLAGGYVNQVIQTDNDVITASWEVMLKADGTTNNRVRTGFYDYETKKNIIIIDFTKNQDGSWKASALGSDETNAGAAYALNKADKKTQFTIAASESDNWQKIAIVHYPTTKKTEYYINGERVYNADWHTQGNFSDTGLGSFACFLQSADTGYAGVDNILITKGTNPGDAVVYNNITEGESSLSYNWDVMLKTAPSADEVKVHKYDNAEETLKNNGTEVTDAAVVADEYGLKVTLPAKVKSYEEYRVVVPQVTDLTSKKIKYTFETTVMPDKTAKIVDTKVREYTFDTADGWTTDWLLSVPVKYEDDNRLMTNSGANIGSTTSTDSFAISDTGLKYLDVEVELKALWDTTSTVGSERTLLTLVDTKNSNSALMSVWFDKAQKVLCSNTTADAANPNTNGFTSITEYYKPTDWNSIKIRYYPVGEKGNAAYEVYLKDSKGTYQNISTKKLTAVALTEGSSVSLKLSNIRAGKVYYDNLCFTKGILTAPKADPKVVSVKAADKDNNILPTVGGKFADGASKILIYTSDITEAPQVSLKTDEEDSAAVAFEKSFADNVCTLTLDKLLVGGKNYKLTIGEKVYDFSTDEGEYNVEKMTYDGTKVSINALNTTTNTEKLILMVASYEGNMLKEVSTNAIEIKPGDSGVYSCNAPADLGSSTKAYVWSGDGTFKPIFSAIDKNDTESQE